ncbi:hypothetical protein TrST_g2204 [Triparma strigata]|uniref:Nucleoid-associated protein n=1 Tax=Triparma strigata TaxID=1606541 RepID=A0A9W7BFD7_9STRA|nr:hypothetical protein TrST_g2204 [Triparma strigata]
MNSLTFSAVCLCLLLSSSTSFTFFLPSSTSSSTSLNLFGGKKDPSSSPAAGGMGGMGNMMEQFKKAQEIAKKTQELQSDLAKEMITGTAGTVTVTVNGQQKPEKVELGDMTLSAEEMSEDVKKAIDDAHAKSMKVMGEKMQTLYEGLGLPGMGGAPEQ